MSNEKFVEKITEKPDLKIVKSIHQKLIEMQTTLKAPKELENKFGNYKYRSCESILEAVKPLLKAHSLYLTITDEILNIGERYYIKATVTLTDGQEKIETTALAREAETKKGMDDSQITGATSSYARKYALNGLFCIDDNKDADDLNKHGKEEVKEKKETPVGELINLKQKTELKEFLGGAKFAELMNSNGGKVTIDQFNELMKG